jgi:hypothetical protein
LRRFAAGAGPEVVTAGGGVMVNGIAEIVALGPRPLVTGM